MRLEQAGCPHIVAGHTGHAGWNNLADIGLTVFKQHDSINVGRLSLGSSPPTALIVLAAD